MSNSTGFSRERCDEGRPAGQPKGLRWSISCRGQRQALRAELVPRIGRRRRPQLMPVAGSDDILIDIGMPEMRLDPPRGGARGRVV